jgi:hypothetical protein
VQILMCKTVVYMYIVSYNTIEVFFCDAYYVVVPSQFRLHRGITEENFACFIALTIDVLVLVFFCIFN